MREHTSVVLCPPSLLRGRDVTGGAAPSGADEPAALSTTEVSLRARQETARYYRGEPHDDRFSRELFRRAITRGDDACWSELLTLYADQVTSWCRRAAAGMNGDIDELVNLAWQRFWRNFTPVKLRSATATAQILRYLKMCAYSVTVDAVRRGPATLSLDASCADRADDSPALDEWVMDGIKRAALWQVVEGCVHGERERVLVRLMFAEGMRSAEIQAHRPDLFADVTEVYRTTRNVLARLRRSAALRQWAEQERRAG